MRVGFLSDSYNDPESIGSWSGLPYYFARLLREAGCEIVPIRGRDAVGSLSEKIKQAAWLLARKRYLRGLSHGPLRAYARSVEPLLKTAGVDVVFSVNSWLLAYLETDLPTVFWTDATFASMLGFYESFSRLAPTSLRSGHEIEQRVLDRSSLAVYSSHWAAQSAQADYKADPARIIILPFGANLDPMPTREEVTASLDRKLGAGAICELSCIGVDWKRKGVDLAVGAAAELTRRGVPVRLRIAGCKIPEGIVLPANVEVIGFLDKNSPEGRRRLQSLYRESHFFLLPSRAEAFGVVLSEACAFGLPSLTTDVGGLPDVIRAGVNGFRFPLEAGAGAYADWIADLWADPARYRELALNTFNDFHENLSGSKSAVRLAARMRALIASAAPNPLTQAPAL